MLCLCCVYAIFRWVYCQFLDFRCFLLQDFQHSEFTYMSSFNSPITNLPGFVLELLTFRSSFKLQTCQVLRISQLFVIAVFQMQKQPFADVLQNGRIKKFRNIHRETPVLESLFKKVVI